jgi:hypothetical protein
MSNAYCYSVSGYGNMVVGHGLVKTSSSLFSARRMLLSADEGPQDDSGNLSSSWKVHERGVPTDPLLDGIRSFAAWNHTQEPCSLLVLAYTENKTSLGVLDMHALGRCLHWRKVGKGIVDRIEGLRNVSSHSPSGGETRNESDCCSHAFMSVGDFVSVVGRHKGVGLGFLEHLPLVISALLDGSQIFHGLQSIADAAKQNAVMMYMERVWQRAIGTDFRNMTRANATEVALMKRFIREHKRQIALFHVYATEPFLFGGVAHASSSSSGDAANHSSLNASAEAFAGKKQSPPVVVNATDRSVDSHLSKNASTYSNGSLPFPTLRRRILQQQEGLGEVDRVVDSYTSLVASTKGFSSIAIASMSASRGKTSLPLITDTWLEGPFGWPPRYDFYGSDAVRDGKCAAFEVGVRSTVDVMRVVKAYYETDFAGKVGRDKFYWTYVHDVFLMLC